MSVAIRQRPVALLALLLSLGGLHAARAPQRFVEVGADGKLVYEIDKFGNRIPDFSHAGYKGGGVAIPEVSPRVTVSAAGGDARVRIQAAIDFVSTLPADAEGLPGAVLLGRGRTRLSGAARCAFDLRARTGVRWRACPDVSVARSPPSGRRGEPAQRVGVGPRKSNG